jgi:hypothetical protein
MQLSALGPQEVPAAVESADEDPAALSYLKARGKLVRPDFLQGMSKRWDTSLQRNRLVEDAW